MPTRRTFLAHSAAAGFAALACRPAAAAASASDRRARGIVNTVQGPLDASKLGFTLPHEHVCVGSGGMWQAWPELFGGRGNFIARAVDGLKAIRDEGVDTIVDVTPFDIGRDVRLLEEVSRKSGMQIVASTGHWLMPSLAMGTRSVEELTDFFTQEIERGMEGTDIKAGVIKVATGSEGVTPFLDRTLRAAARASKATGVPITTHTDSLQRMGDKQAAIFEAEGLSPARVSIGHSDDTDNLDYLIGLAKRGFTVCMDHLPYGIPAGSAAPEPGEKTAKPGPLSWQQRAQSIKRLVEAGYGDRIFLSNDWFLSAVHVPASAIVELGKMNPDGMLFNTRKVIPYMKQIGVTEQAIRAITVENPRRFFGGT